MRKNIILGAVGLGIAGVFLTGGIANAGVNAKISLSKSKVVAGEEITVNGECYADNFSKAPILSSALESGKVVALVNPGESLKVSGKARVKKDIKPGTYTVSFNCDGWQPTANLTVVATEKPQPKPTTSKPEPKGEEGGQVAVKPKGAADTGEGDVVVEAAPAVESNGPGVGLYALGGAGLAAAAGGAGVFMLRRRSRA